MPTDLTELRHYQVINRKTSMMPSSSAPGRKDVHIIDEMKLKLKLLESDNRAIYERTEKQLKENKELILKLRKENKEKRKVLSKANLFEDISFEDQAATSSKEIPLLASKSMEWAVETLDDKFFDYQKTLNLLKFENERRMKKLEDLKKQNAMLNVDDDGDVDGVVVLSSGGKQDAELEMKFRTVENELDKTRVKCGEAEQLQKTYHQIRSGLEEEHKHLRSILDGADVEIKRLEEQMEKLKPMLVEASKLRDEAKQELEKKEKKIASERKVRTAEMEELRKEIEKMKKYEDGLKNGKDEISMSFGRAAGRLPENVEEEEGRLERLEETILLIKRSIGVSDTKGLVRRFEEQRSRQQQLEAMKQTNEEKIRSLEEERKKLFRKFRELEFTQKLQSVSADGEDEKEEVMLGTVDDDDEESDYKKKLYETDLEKKRIEGQIRERALNVEKMEATLVELRVGLSHLVGRLTTVEEKQDLLTRDEYGDEEARVKDVFQKEEPDNDVETLYADDENGDLLQKFDLCRSKLLYLYKLEKQIHSGIEAANLDNDRFKINLASENEDSQSMGALSRVSKESTSRSDAKEVEEEDEESDDDEWMQERERMKKKSQEILDRKMANASDIKKL